MNATLFLFLFSLIANADTPCTKALEESEARIKANRDEMAKLESLATSYRRGKINPKQAVAFQQSANGVAEFKSEADRTSEIRRLQIRAGDIKQEQDSIKKLGLYVSDWHTEGTPEIGAIGRFSMPVTVGHFEDKSTIGFITSYKNKNHLGQWGGGRVSVLLDGVDTNKVAEGRPFQCPPMMIIYGEKETRNRTYLLAKPITLEEIKKRAADEKAAK